MRVPEKLNFIAFLRVIQQLSIPALAGQPPIERGI
jgi:hypothetical protein